MSEIAPGGIARALEPGTEGRGRGRIGMLCLIASEAALFAVFVVTYLFYLGADAGGPARDAPFVNTACLLSSSFTIAWAVRALRAGQLRRFGAWWGLSLALGAEFLLGTAFEWRHLIVDEGLGIGASLWSSTFFGLVGLHAAHVSLGAAALALVLALSLLGRVKPDHAERVELLSWYWHFVDAVWVVVFGVVYGVGR